jgi:hypothetical protein
MDRATLGAPYNEYVSADLPIRKERLGRLLQHEPKRGLAGIRAKTGNLRAKRLSLKEMQDATIPCEIGI